MKKAEKEEMEKMEKLLETIEKHPLTQQIKAEKATEVLATRQEADAKIEMFRNEQGAVIPKLQEDRAGKEKIYLATKDAMQAASDEFQSAKAALASENHRITHAISQQEGILFETADPQIDDAIQFFRDKLDDLRRPGRIDRVGRASKLNIFSMSRTTTTESNVDAIKLALAYCQNAIRQLEKWKLIPAVDSEKIAELKAGLPRIDVYQEITGEKPMGRTNTDPRSLLPSDSQMEWEIGKLNEKFKKLMKK